MGLREVIVFEFKPGKIAAPPRRAIYSAYMVLNTKNTERFTLLKNRVCFIAKSRYMNVRYEILYTV